MVELPFLIVTPALLTGLVPTVAARSTCRETAHGLHADSWCSGTHA
ncbi:hypothetical protein Deipe_3763 [Deinococcus peraridilitoris DSM 19664]|uniref:Uncharacterized protein n=1 Tax=Deinococcus peraridilitoris (strain DSM 19664 / LMG 22246 / CIP 109416 / KR-200) TaxID=937777 RepID=L0A5N1_DEIPD|nr:hypothetical protein Deipe_3763 [Deinococcus peraridilitoris DSM 19664]